MFLIDSGMMIHTVSIENTHTHTHSGAQKASLCCWQAGLVNSGSGVEITRLFHTGPRRITEPGSCRTEWDGCGDVNHNRGRARTQKRWTAARDRYNPPRHTLVVF